MRKKTKHNNHKGKQFASQKKQVPIPTQIVFTMPVVKTLKDSLANFEILLHTERNKTIPNLELAHLTFSGLKQKLTDMLEREEWEEATPLDYNEHWILYTALAMHTVEMQRNNEKNTAKLLVCLTLCSQFKAIIEANK